MSGLLLACILAMVLWRYLAVSRLNRQLLTAIAERKRAEEALRERARLYHASFEQSSAVKLLIDPATSDIVDANFAAIEFYGYSLSQLKAMKITDINLLPTEHVQTEMTKAYTKQRKNFIFRHRLASGDVRDVEVYSGPIVIGKRHLLHSIIQDITERKQAEETLKLQSEIISNMVEGVVLIQTSSGRIVYSNPKFEEMFGYEAGELIGKDISLINAPTEISPEEGARDIIESLLKDGIYHGEVLNIKKDGTHLWCYANISTFIHRDYGKVWISVHHDITERKRMEEDRVVMSKLESTGILAGGIAHDFNNFLSVILGNLGLVKMFNQSGEEMNHSLEAAEKAAWEAQDLTQQLITLARGGEPVKRLISLSSLLQEQVTLTLRGSHMAYEFSITTDLWPVEVDGGQIGQVIRNIGLNAREAMPEGGTILVLAANVALTQPSNLPLPPGNYLKISVSDQGQGIPEEILSKIFDPYFSTKQRGPQKGMGLGLTIKTLEPKEYS